jgi:hypothetical protein
MYMPLINRQNASDENMLVGGAPAITLKDLEDPQGVCRLARSARHYLLDKKVHEGMQAMFSN